MSEAQHLAQAIEQLFVSDAPAWFTPFAVATDGLSAEQAATSPAPRFNSIWAVVNHVRFWQEVALLQLQDRPVDKVTLGSPDANGWPPIGDPHDDTAWHAARHQALTINHDLADWIASLADADLEHLIAEAGAWNQRRHLIQGIIAHNSYHTCEVISIRHLNSWWFDAM